MFRILVVEDDIRLGQSLRTNLELRGYHVVHATSIKAGKDAVQSRKPNACLLDLNLPDGDGLKFCDFLRTVDKEIPILMISARHDENSVVNSLATGADDYLRKPFGMRELAIRLEKLLKKQKRQEQVIELEGVFLYIERQEAYFRGKNLKLARREVELLARFLNYPSRIYSRSQLLDFIGGGEDLQERTIDSHISNLRHKLKKVGCCHTIQSVYGSGYRMHLAEIRQAK